VCRTAVSQVLRSPKQLGLEKLKVPARQALLTGGRQILPSDLEVITPYLARITPCSHKDPDRYYQANPRISDVNVKHG
jgi:hypothetical protein